MALLKLDTVDNLSAPLTINLTAFKEESPFWRQMKRLSRTLHADIQ